MGACLECNTLLVPVGASSSTNRERRRAAGLRARGSCFSRHSMLRLARYDGREGSCSACTAALPGVRIFRIRPFLCSAWAPIFELVTANGESPPESRGGSAIGLQDELVLARAPSALRLTKETRGCGGAPLDPLRCFFVPAGLRASKNYRAHSGGARGAFRLAERQRQPEPCAGSNVEGRVFRTSRSARSRAPRPRARIGG
jgi:hypothetical protein